MGLGALACGAWAMALEPDFEPDGAALLARFGLGVLAVAVGEALLYPEYGGKYAWAGVGFALVQMGAALCLPKTRRRGRIVAWIGIAGLAVAGVTMAVHADRGWDLYVDPRQLGWEAWSVTAFWAFLLISVLGLAWSASGRRELGRPEAPLARTWEFGLLAAVLAVGGFLRFYQGGLLPKGLWYDEVNLASSTLDFAAPGAQAQMYVGNQVENPGAYLCVGAALFRAFGPSVRVLRLASGFFGCLALLPFWGLARAFFGRRWALVAALGFAVLHWVLIPQRIAFMSGFALFWMLASFWALWHAQLKGGWLRWLGAGLLLGANLHTYTPARFVPLLVLAFLVLQCVLEKSWRRSLPEWTAFAGGFALVAGPMLLWILGHRSEYLYRSEQVSLFNDVAQNHGSLFAALWANIGRHALMFQFRGDFNARHNVFFWPHAGYVLACVLALAFPWTLGRSVRDARGRFLWMWFGLMVAAGVFSLPIEAPQGHRTVLAAPVLPLLAVWTLKELFGELRVFRKGWPLPAYALGSLVLVCMVWGSFQAVFEAWPDSQATFRSFSPRSSAVARRLERTQAGTAVFLSSLPKEYIFYGYEEQAFARWTLRLQGRSFENLGPTQWIPEAEGGVPTRSVLLLWGDSDTDLTAAFKAEFPAATVEQEAQPFPGPGEPDHLYLAAEIPVAEVPMWDGKGLAPLVYRKG